MSGQGNPPSTHGTPPQLALPHLTTGFWVSQALYVAAELGIADLLQDGLRSSDDLAPTTETDARALYRALRALASVGVFTEVEPGRFGLTPVAEYLQTGRPGSLHAWAIMCGEDRTWRPWGALLYSVKTGRPALEQLFGMGQYDYLAQHPEAAQIFDEAITSFSAASHAAVLAGYDFSPFGTIVDVGGGQGSFLAAILKANSQMKGILFDALPSLPERGGCSRPRAWGRAVNWWRATSSRRCPGGATPTS